MSDSTRQPAPEITPPNPAALPGTPEAPGPGGGEVRPEARESSPDAPGPVDPTMELRRTAHLTRLPPELRDEILARLPPLEEEERILREMIEKGELSSENSIESVLREFEREP